MILYCASNGAEERFIEFRSSLVTWGIICVEGGGDVESVDCSFLFGSHKENQVSNYIVVLCISGKTIVQRSEEVLTDG